MSRTDTIAFGYPRHVHTIVIISHCFSHLLERVPSLSGRIYFGPVAVRERRSSEIIIGDLFQWRRRAAAARAAFQVARPQPPLGLPLRIRTGVVEIGLHPYPVTWKLLTSARPVRGSLSPASFVLLTAPVPVEGCKGTMTACDTQLREAFGFRTGTNVTAPLSHGPPHNPVALSMSAHVPHARDITDVNLSCGTSSVSESRKVLLLRLVDMSPPPAFDYLIFHCPTNPRSPLAVPLGTFVPLSLAGSKLAQLSPHSEPRMVLDRSTVVTHTDHHLYIHRQEGGLLITKRDAANVAFNVETLALQLKGTNGPASIAISATAPAAAFTAALPSCPPILAVQIHSSVAYLSSQRDIKAAERAL